MTMKLIKKIGMLSCVVLAPLVHAELDTELLLGTWTCSVDMSEEGVTMSMSSTVNYLAEGLSTSDGQIDMQIPMLQADLSYAVEAKGTWEVQENYLFETLTEFSLQSIKASDMDNILNEEAFPLNEAIPSEIVSLSANELVVRNDNSPAMTCVR
jgi:hypothetical protein